MKAISDSTRACEKKELYSNEKLELSTRTTTTTRFVCTQLLHAFTCANGFLAPARGTLHRPCAGTQAYCVVSGRSRKARSPRRQHPSRALQGRKRLDGRMYRCSEASRMSDDERRGVLGSRGSLKHDRARRRPAPALPGKLVWRVGPIDYGQPDETNQHKVIHVLIAVPGILF